MIDPERELAAPPDLPEPPDDAAGEPLVADIMSRRLVAVRSDVDLMVAVDVFLRHAVRHLLVVDPDRTFRGLLSAEHVLAAIATIGRGRPSVGAHVGGRPPRVRRDATVREAAEVMLAELVDALPVVDHDGRVVGLVTWTDIVALVAGHHLGARRVTPARRVR